MKFKKTWKNKESERLNNKRTAFPKYGSSEEATRGKFAE